MLSDRDKEQAKGRIRRDIDPRYIEFVTVNTQEALDIVQLVEPRLTQAQKAVVLHLEKNSESEKESK